MRTLEPARTISGRRQLLLLCLLTVTPALANWVALWLLNDSWLAITLCSIIFYSGGFWVAKAYRLNGRFRVRKGWWQKSLGLGLLSAAVVAAVITVTGNIYFQKAIPGNILAVCSQRLCQSQALRYSFWQFFAFVAVILPVGEEMYWRGGLQGLLARRYGPKRTIMVSALLFSAYHCVTIAYLMPSPAGLPLLATVFVGGMLFAWMTEYTGNIWAAAICHGLGAWGAMIYLVWKLLR